jgi:uncharacterized protein (TIGR03084 family)
MSGGIASLAADLAAERGSLRGTLAGIAHDDWDTPTPAEGYDIRDQVWHLAWYDGAARRAVCEPEGFEAESARATADMDTYDQAVVEQGRSLSAAEVDAAWSAEATSFDAAVLAPEAPRRVRWYMTSMSLTSLITARLMETWAHGQDVRDAVGQPAEATDRLGHVAHLGCISLPYAFGIRGRPVPQSPVRVELDLPSGARFAYGPQEATDRVVGPVLDFCLVVTQRRHLSDVDLSIVGETARSWMPISQAFAGPPGAGRAPGQFSATGATR